MKYYLFIAFISCLLSGCKEETSKTKIFWNWFKENQSEFHKIDSSDRDEKLSLIIEHLNPIAEELSVEISNEENGIRNLTISPEGDRTKFKIVKEIVNNAPKLKGWAFTAFRQPYDKDFILEFEDIKFDIENMYFIPLIDKDTLDLEIYSNNRNAEDTNAIGKYGLITIDNILGEYDCTMKVRYYTFLNIKEASEKNKLIPLRNLKVFVDSFYKSNPNKNGL